MINLPPSLVMIIGGLLIGLLASTQGARKRLGQVLSLIVPLLTLAVAFIAEGSLTVPFLEYHLALLSVDKVATLFGIIFSIAAFAGALYGLKTASYTEIAAAFVYAGSAIGVAYAGDLVSVFVYWELMAVASTMVIWAGATTCARNAAFRYILIHLFGGVVLFIGVVAYIAHQPPTNGVVTLQAIGTDHISGWLILAGFLINAGAPPLWSWIADAYPESSISGSVFLSAFTTKTAVLVLWRCYPGEPLLMYLGLAMVLYGVVYALLENDIRRVLVYSLVGQVGYMLAILGVGEPGVGDAYGREGVLAHAFTHITYKALLLMTAGAVIYATGKRKFTDLGGIADKMPLVAFGAIIGGLSISAAPFTAGFVSKALLLKGAAHANEATVWFALMFASAVAFLYVGLKFPWFAFFHKHNDVEVKRAVPLNMKLAIMLLSGLCIAIGVYPDMLFMLLPHEGKHYEPYTIQHIVNQAQLLVVSAIVFFLVLKYLQPAERRTLDFDVIYRKVLPAIVVACITTANATYQSILGLGQRRLSKDASLVNNLHTRGGLLERTWPSSGMTFWAVIFLSMYLLFYYFL